MLPPRLTIERSGAQVAVSCPSYHRMEIAKIVGIELGSNDCIGQDESCIFGDVGHRGELSVGRAVGRKWVRWLAVDAFVATKRKLGPRWRQLTV